MINWRDEYKLSKQPFRYGVGVSATASPLLAQTGQAANPLSAFHLRRDLLHPARLSAPGVTSLVISRPGKRCSTISGACASQALRTSSCEPGSALASGD